MNNQNKKSSKKPNKETTHSQKDSLKNEVNQLIEEKNEFKNLLQRTQADFVNYKKRMEQEKITIIEQASSRVIKKFLEIMDDFELAINTIDKLDESKNSWIEGINLIQKKILTLLESENVKKMETNNVEFDPAFHEAIAKESSILSEGTIIRVIKNGYTQREQLLRPAQVILSSGKDTNK